MKKIILILLLLGVPFYLMDMYAHLWAENQMEDVIKRSTQSKSAVEVKIGSRIIDFGDYHMLPNPMMIRMVSTGVIKDVNVKVYGRMNIRELSLDSINIHMDKIFVNKTNVVSRKGVSLDDIRGGTIELRTSTKALTSSIVETPISVDGIGRATARIGNKDYPLKVKVDDESVLSFIAAGRVIERIDLGGTRFLTCRPKAEFVSGALKLSCPFTRIPGILSGSQG